MPKINVNIFGSPKITIDGKEIKITSKKITALFLYIFINKTVTRNELVFILWPDKNDEIGRKNLRNSLYKLKKILGEESILTQGNEIIKINEKLVASNYEDLKDKDFLKGEYKGILMKGFLLKDNINFANWIENLRISYNTNYINSTLIYIKELDMKKDFKEIELYVRDIIKIDEYNEIAYSILIELYYKNKMYIKAIEVYETLCRILDNELGITPTQDVQKLYEEIENLINEDHTKINRDEKTHNFYGRTNELIILKRNYESFINNDEYRSMILIGEAGIGKTKLKKHFIENHIQQSVNIAEVNCHQIDEGFYLKSWNAMILKLKDIIIEEEISIPKTWSDSIGAIFPSFTDYEESTKNQVLNFNDFKFQYVEEIIIRILKKISNKKKLIIIFEDIQWMDSVSLRLLEKIILENNKDILIIATVRNINKVDMDDFFSTVSRYDTIEKIEMKRYDKKETIEFSKELFPQIDVDSKLLDKIYKETEGLPFFLLEFLNAIKENRDIGIMTSKMKDIIKSRFYKISKKAMEILEISSVLFDKIELQLLSIVMQKSNLEILEIIEELKSRFILKEIESEKNTYVFTHQKLREFIYENQPFEKRRIYHNKVAISLEIFLDSNDQDYIFYPRLIYHFLNANNDIKVLEYKIKYLKNFLDFEHELFPLINQRIKKDELLISKEDVFNHFTQINKLIEDLKLRYKDDIIFLNLRLEYLHMIGRFFIKEGLYIKGVDKINELIEIGSKIKNHEYVILGKKQIIYAAIQTHDTYMMDQSIKSLFELIDKDACLGEIGILYRLKALGSIMKGDYQRAESDLKTSINYFRREKKKGYLLNLAASYNYLGDIRRNNMNFKSALKYYDQAIQICQKDNIVKGIAVFNSNAGQCAFELGDYEKSFEYLNFSIATYEKYDFTWNASKAYCYMALILFKKDDYLNSLKCLERADDISIKLKNPYDIGLVYKTKASIKIFLQGNYKASDIFGFYLDQDIKKYCHEGLKYFSSIKTCYEKEVLYNIIKNNL